MPAMQGTPVWQTLPQEPQLLRSLTMSMQLPPQKPWPGEQRLTHMHWVESKSWLALQLIETQAPLQRVSPVPQLV